MVWMNAITMRKWICAAGLVHTCSISAVKGVILFAWVLLYTLRAAIRDIAQPKRKNFLNETKPKRGKIRRGLIGIVFSQAFYTLKFSIFSQHRSLICLYPMIFWGSWVFCTNIRMIWQTVGCCRKWNAIMLATFWCITKCTQNDPQYHP